MGLCGSHVNSDSLWAQNRWQHIFAQEIQTACAGATFFVAPFWHGFGGGQHNRSGSEVAGRRSEVHCMQESVAAGALGEHPCGEWAQAGGGHDENLQCSQQSAVSLKCKFEDWLEKNRGDDDLSMTSNIWSDWIFNDHYSWQRPPNQTRQRSVRTRVKRLSSASSDSIQRIPDIWIWLGPRPEVFMNSNDHKNNWLRLDVVVAPYHIFNGCVTHECHACIVLS